jgi:hypothetical protein
MQRSRHLAFAAAVAIILVVAAPGPSPALASTPTRAATAHTQREVFGFALASSLTDPTAGYSTWNFDLLSTVAFFGVHVGSGGVFVGDSGWNTWNSSALTGLVSTAHAHGTKVVLSVILQDFSPNTPAMCDGLRHPDATVAQAVYEMKAKGVDGVNLDYEGLDGSCGQSDSYWAQHAYTSLVARMRAGLGSSYYLSVDTYASSAVDGYGFFDVPNLAAYADSLFVMAYDLEYSNYPRLPASCSQFCLGPTAPLSGYYYNDSTVVSQYVSSVGAGKVILGVPYYGRKACVGGAVPNGYPTSSVIADSYLDATSEASDPAVQAGTYGAHRDSYSSGGERWDTWYNTSLRCTRELYWDDAVSLGRKYDLVNAQKLRGVGIWNLNYGGGAPELWSALRSHFGACASVSASVSPASPQVTGTTVVISAAASGCATPLYQFWLLPPGSTTWQVARAYSPTASYTWNTAGQAAGQYTYTVWARDAGSSGASCGNLGCSDAYAPATKYSLVRPCTGVTESVAPVAPQLAGASVVFVARASGCPNPQYQFWALAPGSHSWQVLQPYSSASTFTWSTRGVAAGSYLYTVWARDASSAGVSCGVLGCQDAFAPATGYAVDTPCTSVSEAVSAASPQQAGATVTFTATATGCPRPLFQFWVLPPGSHTWQIVQPYSATSTFTWDTSSASGGTYLYTVWARDTASPGPLCSNLGCTDVYYPATGYRLNHPCTSVKETVSAASPERVGTPITFTALAAGCANPLYEFWALAPGSHNWVILQSYSPTSTFTWSTSNGPAGTYLYTVWVRDASSPGTGCSNLGCSDAYFAATPFTLT